MRETRVPRDLVGPVAIGAAPRSAVAIAGGGQQYRGTGCEYGRAVRAAGRGRSHRVCRIVCAAHTYVETPSTAL